MKALERFGFQKGKRVPPTKTADEIWQRHIVSEDLDIDFYLTAWVYRPSDYNPKTTVEFDLQIDHDEREADHSTRIEMFSFTENSLSDRKMEDIIRRSRNLYNYLQYV